MDNTSSRGKKKRMEKKARRKRSGLVELLGRWRYSREVFFFIRTERWKDNENVPIIIHSGLVLKKKLDGGRKRERKFGVDSGRNLEKHCTKARSIRKEVQGLPKREVCGDDFNTGKRPIFCWE